MNTPLTPSYKLSVAITLLSVPILFIQLGIGIFLAILGLFLIYQTNSIRLIFTESALEVRRKETLLKTFPYSDWESWTIFWPPIPILFYFKEVNSIHFLPVLFSPTELQSCLKDKLEERISSRTS